MYINRYKYEYTIRDGVSLRSLHGFPPVYCISLCCLRSIHFSMLIKCDALCLYYGFPFCLFPRIVSLYYGLPVYRTIASKGFRFSHISLWRVLRVSSAHHLFHHFRGLVQLKCKRNPELDVKLQASFIQALDKIRLDSTLLSLHRVQVLRQRNAV